MKKCHVCSTTIIFGGKEYNNLYFCNDECLYEGQIAITHSSLSDHEINTIAKKIHKDLCPLCHSRHGVELHKSYFTVSFVYYTKRYNYKHICCSTCGFKEKLLDFIKSFLLGWWAFPLGIIITPIYLLLNIYNMIFSADTDEPSEDFKEIISLRLAQEKVDN